jgi:hypothetical protein
MLREDPSFGTASCYSTAYSLEIISQISQPARSVFLSQKNQPAVLSASQISPSE